MKRIILILLCVLCCVLRGDLSAQTKRDGEIFFNEGRYQEAYDVYTKLMGKYPKDNLLKYQVGRCLYEMGRYDEAVVLFEKAADKDVVKANYYLYDIYFSQYKFAEAELVISKYLSSLGEVGDQVDECLEKDLRAKLAIKMLDRVEDIAIVDSVKIEKSNFLSAYNLSRDLGKLALYSRVYDEPTEQIQLVYYTGRGDKMIFSNTDKTENLDLKVAYRLVDGWSDASDLSSVLNTRYDENFPFELSDGVTLYFASKGHNSLGGYDIFLTRYNGTINDYSKPINIGMPFNSPANDYLYVIDEMSNIGWFATDRFQHEDTIVVYKFVPNEEKLLIQSDDEEYKRLVAQLKVYRKANVETYSDAEKTEDVDKQDLGINFLVNDGVVYTHMSQFKSEEAKSFYMKVQDTEKRLLTLLRLLEGKRREFFFCDIEEDKNVLREEVLELERDVRRYKELIDEYVYQTRCEEIKVIDLGVRMK